MNGDYFRAITLCVFLLVLFHEFYYFFASPFPFSSQSTYFSCVQYHFPFIFVASLLLRFCYIFFLYPLFFDIICFLYFDIVFPLSFMYYHCIVSSSNFSRCSIFLCRSLFLFSSYFRFNFSSVFFFLTPRFFVSVFSRLLFCYTFIHLLFFLLPYCSVLVPSSTFLSINLSIPCQLSRPSLSPRNCRHFSAPFFPRSYLSMQGRSRNM